MSAADFDEGYRQGRRDTRAEMVPVIDRQRAEIIRLRETVRGALGCGVSPEAARVLESIAVPS